MGDNSHNVLKSRNPSIQNEGLTVPGSISPKKKEDNNKVVVRVSYVRVYEGREDGRRVFLVLEPTLKTKRSRCIRSWITGDFRCTIQGGEIPVIEIKYPEV